MDEKSELGDVTTSGVVKRDGLLSNDLRRSEFVLIGIFETIVSLGVIEPEVKLNGAGVFVLVDRMVPDKYLSSFSH